jgi:hypothetical protein
MSTLPLNVAPSVQHSLAATFGTSVLTPMAAVIRTHGNQPFPLSTGILRSCRSACAYVEKWLRLTLQYQTSLRTALFEM